MSKILNCLFTVVLLSGCMVSDDERYNRKILGSTAVFSQGEYEIVSDIKMSELQIRHVKSVHKKSNCELPTQNSHNIQISGPINSDTPLVVERLIQKIKADPNRCKSKASGKFYAIEVLLSSGGGYLDDGIALGKLFRRESVEVSVTFGAKCFSSCATAFLGGQYRNVNGDGVLLFHAPYNMTNFGTINCQSSNNKLKNYIIDMIGETNGRLLYERTMQNCDSNDGWTINKDAAEMMGITT